MKLQTIKDDSAEIGKYNRTNGGGSIRVLTLVNPHLFEPFKLAHGADASGVGKYELLHV